MSLENDSPHAYDPLAGQVDLAEIGPGMSAPEKSTWISRPPERQVGLRLDQGRRRRKRGVSRRDGPRAPSRRRA